MSKLEQLKSRADELGVNYHHRAGEAKIEAAINAFLAEQEGEAEAVATDVQFAHPVNQAQVDADGKIRPYTSEEFRKMHKGDRKKDMNRLIRCRVTCMNPTKRDWQGEIISVGSAKNGTFKKYVPFDGREYHIPKVILDEMRSRQCSIFYNTRDPRGQTVRKARLQNEFSIDILPNLTQEELAKLRRQQSMADGAQPDF